VFSLLLSNFHFYVPVLLWTVNLYCTPDCCIFALAYYVTDRSYSRHCQAAVTGYLHHWSAHGLPLQSSTSTTVSILNLLLFVYTVTLLMIVTNSLSDDIDKAPPSVAVWLTWDTACQQHRCATVDKVLWSLAMPAFVHGDTKFVRYSICHIVPM